MTQNQTKFFNLVSKYDFTKPYWNKSTLEMDYDLILSEIDTLSDGERSFVKFLVGVWMGHNELNFDFIQDLSNMKGELREDYLKWVSDPFFL